MKNAEVTGNQENHPSSRKVLGLDLGTNSIGWAISEPTIGRVLAQGVRIFAEGVKIEKGQLSSKAAERTGYRSARRKIFRRRKRKQATLKVLIKHNMCPLSLEDLQAWEKSKKAYPSATEFIEWQKCYHIKSTSVSNPQNRNVYYLRSKAVHEKLSPRELGRVMYHFAQRRGFLSNRLDQTKADETGKVKGAISELQTRKGDRTLGELFYEYHLEGKKVRGHYTGRKEDYLQEFNRICEVQNVAPELKTELYNAIFFQRPLKSQKGSIGTCVFEKRKPRCPISHPDFEEYRMLQFFNTIKCGATSEPRNNYLQIADYFHQKVGSTFFGLANYEEGLQKLKDTIFPKFYRKSKDIFQFKDLLKDLRNLLGDVCFNYPDDYPVSGCPTTAGFIHAFGEDWKQSLTERYSKKHAKPKTTEEIVEDVWHALFSFDDDEKLKAWIQKHFDATEEESDNYISTKCKQGYSNLSLKAIRNINPFLRIGYIYTYAVFCAKLKDILPAQIWQKPEEQKEVIAKVKSVIDTHQSYLQTIRAVNDLIKEYVDMYKTSTGNYQPADVFFKEKRSSVVASFQNWKKTYDRLTNEEKKELEDLFIQQVTEHQMQPVKPKRMDERIRELLKTEYGATEQSSSQLYHPSAIDMYPQAKMADDGKLYLGSPRIPAFKNPVVMRALHELKTLVNYLIKTDQIDPDTRIHIELARELNSLNQRKAIEQYQRDRQKLRDQYRKEIADHYERHGLNKEVNNDDILKYELWKEQDSQCYYCRGDESQISISELLGNSSDIDIEHTIPLSQFFDDSMQNKSVCHARCNREVKGGRMPGELDEDMRSKIQNRLQPLRDRREDLIRILNKVKKAPGYEDKDAKDLRITKKNKVLLELDYINGKLRRFEIKELKTGFTNSQIVDTGIITSYAFSYLRSAFDRVVTYKGALTAEFRRLWGLQSIYEQKDRATHFHHCVDAIVLSCMSKFKNDLLSQYYKAEQDQNQIEKRNLLLRMKPWSCFTEDIRDLEKKTLIVHSSKDNALKGTKKKLRVRGKIQRNEVQKPLYQQGDGVRGALHKETVYGAIETKKENGETEIRYVVRKPLASLEQKDIKNIVDPEIMHIVTAAFNQKEKEFDERGEWIVWQNKDKGVRLRKVRLYANDVVSPLHLKEHRDLSTKEYKQNIHVKNDANYCMALYEGKDESGRLIKDFILINLLEAKNRSTMEVSLYPQQITKQRGRNQYTLPIKSRFDKDFILKNGLSLILCEDEELNLDWDNYEDIQKRLFKIKGFTIVNATGRIDLIHTSEARPISEIKILGGAFDITENKPHRFLYYTQLYCFVENIDFRINPDGTIIRLE